MKRGVEQIVEIQPAALNNPSIQPRAEQGMQDERIAEQYEKGMILQFSPASNGEYNAARLLRIDLRRYPSIQPRVKRGM